MRVLSRRRGWVMPVIGFAHGVLLLPVDIVGAHGLALLLFTGLARERGTALLWTPGLLAAGSTSLLTALTVLLADAEGRTSVDALSLAEGDSRFATAGRFQEWLLHTPLTMPTVALPMVVLGAWAGRPRVLEEPGGHRVPLVRTAVFGLGPAITVGLPSALVYAEVRTGLSPLAEGLLAALHEAAGWGGGLGWAALITLFAARLGTRRGAAVTAAAAVGQRSLSCYPTQSSLFTLVFARYAAELGASPGTTGAAGVAVTAWLATVVLAQGLRRSERRGPAEALLRRLTYAGTSHSPAPWRGSPGSGA